MALKNENGIALFMVLWVLMLLSVIVGEFCYAMRTEVNVTRNFKEQTEGYYIALGGLNRAIGELVRNEFIPEKTSSTTDGSESNNSGGNPFGPFKNNEIRTRKHRKMRKRTGQDGELTVRFLLSR